MVGLDAATFARDVVESAAALIDVFQIDRRREPAVVHHRDAEERLERAASTERMTEVTLLRAERHARAEERIGCTSLGDVTVLGRSAVTIHVADRLRLDLRI